jgi:hypothetical protein
VEGVENFPPVVTNVVEKGTVYAHIEIDTSHVMDLILAVVFYLLILS